MSHQETQHGGRQQCALPSSHTQETELGALHPPQVLRPGLDGPHGDAGDAGRGGGCCTPGRKGKLTQYYHT